MTRSIAPAGLANSSERELHCFGLVGSGGRGSQERGSELLVAASNTSGISAWPFTHWGGGLAETMAEVRLIRPYYWLRFRLADRSSKSSELHRQTACVRDAERFGTPVGSTGRTRPSRRDAYWNSGKVTSISSLLATYRRTNGATKT